MALSLHPQNLTPDAWYYEQPRHIDLIVWTRHKDGTRHAECVKIPWWRLRKSLARYERAQRSE